MRRVPRRAAPVWLDRPAYLNIVSAAAESLNREVNGFLVGRWAYRTIRGRRRRVRLIEAAYPLISSDRKPSWVAPLNEAAYQRAIRVVHGMDVGLTVMGGFHTHPKGLARLSEGDLEFIAQHNARAEGEGWRLHGDRWIELIVPLKHRKAVRTNKSHWYWQEAGDKIRARVWLPGKQRFDITFAAFEVDPDLIEEASTKELRTAVRPVKMLMGL